MKFEEWKNYNTDMQLFKIFQLLSERSKLIVTEEIVKKEIIDPKKISNFALPKTGKYQWYKLLEDDTIKVRKCTNEGCLLFLKWDDDKKKYEHWKYDANTGFGGFVQDKCDFYGG